MGSGCCTEHFCCVAGSRAVKSFSNRLSKSVALNVAVAGSGLIEQGEFTEMAWQAITAAIDVARESKPQVVEPKHLMNALLEQKNGLAR
ncbi:unnamed protein product [Sphagnum jensenii]|uniref:Clp R domain-containing protein n=1 Tax=Sphagnum jensenii TaxID=128206 RepID=A0ABP1AMZ2_9BRYO